MALVLIGCGRGATSKTFLKNTYAFQGQEHDDEIKGEGNSINFEYRMHDPRLGRFFAIDPLAKEYPHNSPGSVSVCHLRQIRIYNNLIFRL